MAESENYKTTIRYYNTNSKQNQKYILVELPDNTTFSPDDRVSISINKIPREFVTTVSKTAPIRITAGYIMRMMDVGDVTTFGYEKWTTIRTIATQIKKTYGSVFTVRKDKQHPENIIVTRVS